MIVKRKINNAFGKDRRKARPICNWVEIIFNWHGTPLVDSLEHTTDITVKNSLFVIFLVGITQKPFHIGSYTSFTYHVKYYLAGLPPLYRDSSDFPRAKQRQKRKTVSS